MTSQNALDAFRGLTKSAPDWAAKLDELNGQIALRQIELARLTEDQPPPPPRSIRNKGSTESLRPQEEGGNPVFEGSAENDRFEVPDMRTVESPRSAQNGFPTSLRPSSPTAARKSATTTVGRNASPPKTSSNSNPRPVPGALQRHTSQPINPTQPRINRAIFRKRKTDSLASGESNNTPKTRTRSMIIVYYDSQVQSAFEELVKNISGVRNAMRKAKMAAKMAEMRRAAELEVNGEEDEDDLASGGDLLATKKSPAEGKEGNGLTVDGAGDTTKADDGLQNDLSLPKLQVVSPRNMGARDQIKKGQILTSPMNLSVMRNYRRSGGGGGGAPDIFDDVDKGLEWCQSQCEHAAHQFLREGECTTEIENIKKKLGEVKTTAEKELDKLEAEKPTTSVAVPRRADEARDTARELRLMSVRRDIIPIKALEVDMEVDDEAVDDLDFPPKLVFKRSRDYRPV
ncbi:hypothetical protein B7494_g7616 [Chlorociboria aeruginascens]|nr:hypothetical protein B7494_g7616 [Chlorociboria aeruginascens]